MKHELECPYCDGIASLHIEPSKLSFRKEEFEVNSSFYKCNKCNQEFTEEYTDTITLEQVYNQYREAHNILFPSEIQKIRSIYNISAKKMSEILGFGINQYRNYENGEVPSESNNSLLLLIRNPIDFMKLIEEKKSQLKDLEIPKIISHLNSLIKSESSHTILSHISNFNQRPNRFNGFVQPSLEKLSAMINYLADSFPYRVRMNKLLFYADFLSYKYRAYSISGLRYAAIDMGPVIDDYKYIFDYLSSNELIVTNFVKVDNDYQEFINNKVDLSLFTSDERDVLEIVKTKFGSLDTDSLKKISHEEFGWIDNFPSKSIIDYQKYASLLKHF